MSTWTSAPRRGWSVALAPSLNSTAARPTFSDTRARDDGESRLQGKRLAPPAPTQMGSFEHGAPVSRASDTSDACPLN